MSAARPGPGLPPNACTARESPTMDDTVLPTSAEELLARLCGMGIDATTFSHPPLHTVEEARRLRGDLPGAHIKNLFLRNRKGSMWLLTCLEDRALDLRELGERLGAGRLSFASAERLQRYLGVLPGAVTPLAVVNDTGNDVQMVLDRAILDRSLVNCHPLVNDRTTALTPSDLLRFLEATGHTPEWIDLDGT